MKFKKISSKDSPKSKLTALRSQWTFIYTQWNIFTYSYNFYELRFQLFLADRWYLRFPPVRRQKDEFESHSNSTLGKKGKSPLQQTPLSSMINMNSYWSLALSSKKLTDWFESVCIVRVFTDIIWAYDQWLTDKCLSDCKCPETRPFGSNLF